MYLQVAIDVSLVLTQSKLLRSYIQTMIATEDISDGLPLGPSDFNLTFLAAFSYCYCPFDPWLGDCPRPLNLSKSQTLPHALGMQ